MPRLKSACPLPFRVRGMPVRRPALLPPASFRRTLLQHPCHQLPFASVGLGMDFVRYTCHNTGNHQLAAGPSPAHIGIGTLIAERPSHTTGHTDHVSGDSAGLADTDKTMWVCWALENETLPAFQHLLHSTGKNTLFDSHNHLPRPFGWGPFGPLPG